MVYADKEKILTHVEKLLEFNPAFVKIDEGDKPEQAAENGVYFISKLIIGK